MKIPPADYQVVKQVVIDLMKDLAETVGYILVIAVVLVLFTLVLTGHIA